MNIRPSKLFLIRAGIALSLVSIAIILQSAWFKKLFVKDPKVSSVMIQSVEDIL